MNKQMFNAGIAWPLLACAAVASSAESQSKPAPAPAQKATISRAVAERTALATVRGGHIKEGELESEKGRLVWSFDITQATTRNVTEVQVDAISGKVVSTAIETPADQAREAAADAARAAHK